MRQLIAAVGALLTTGSFASDAAYIREVEAARAERLAKLTSPDGWLTLIGLHFLKPGANTIGSGNSSDIMLPKGRDRLGQILLADDGAATLTVASTTDVRVDGEKISRAPLAD